MADSAGAAASQGAGLKGTVPVAPAVTVPASDSALAEASAGMLAPGPVLCLASRQTLVLVGLTVCVGAAEVWLLSSRAVPWLPDKVFYLVCVAFQILMMAMLMPGMPEECSSKILDVCHWAFVVMVFSGAFTLRAPESLLLIAVLALLTVGLRLCMGNSCIITMVAQRTSLPNITGRQVTTVFGALLVLSTLRLCLMAIYGRGFPIDQIAVALRSDSDRSASTLTRA
mmetsp:Transcript_6718/g.16005  ORF Transcript_6718/g.16005 Transcript_6718/m.16005 type:complete len:227 (+) Transcript_6718:52-732(+)|eukprot:CAMPEP_0171091934 /NCGR_PEP_ID=MMETSP0766_2-20121228/35407_1 /TAXON_ID=439317 /ORGANISM="Gambierdiscus australes, Strain CAWD 149" /LENGTH=226 /DNA_ID=CAMNT_0011550119 /DNA_START=40 /DNA_END=720 /DNA_ORIENTATION=+